MKKEVRRACPTCRIESYLVIPSNFYVRNGPKKLDLIEDFKASMGEIPCSLFNGGKGECPFRNSCFYSHYLDDGTLYEYDVQVKYHNEKGELVVEKQNEGFTLASYLNFK